TPISSAFTAPLSAARPGGWCRRRRVAYHVCGFCSQGKTGQGSLHVRSPLLGAEIMDRFSFDHLGRAGRLRIAMLVPPWYELPPAGYGGLEQMCAALVDALVARGPDVTLIGAGTRSGTAATFVPTVPRPQYLRLGEGLPELLHVGRANLLIEELDVDVVHDHTS